MVDSVDTTNTPSIPVVIDPTDLVADVVLGWRLVDFGNVIDADSLTSCVPSINLTLNEVADVYRCPNAVRIFWHGRSLHPHVSVSTPSLDDDTYNTDFCPELGANTT